MPYLAHFSPHIRILALQDDAVYLCMREVIDSFNSMEQDVYVRYCVWKVGLETDPRNSAINGIAYAVHTYVATIAAVVQPTFAHPGSDWSRRLPRLKKEMGIFLRVDMGACKGCHVSSFHVGRLGYLRE